MARILVVDDDPLMREMLMESLEAEGHAVETAESGMAGLSKLRAGSFALMTLDVDMPYMSGMQVLKLIRRDPKLAKLPVLMCTAHNMLSSLDSAFRDGATGYIIKPFDIAELSKTIAKALTAPV